MRRRTTNAMLAAMSTMSLLVTTSTPRSAAALPAGALWTCSPDAIAAGTICLDRYEASAWRVPNASTTNGGLVRKIRRGRATRTDLTGGGATQLGTAFDDYAPCRRDGQNCADDVFAVSLPAVLPSASLTWFQAAEACANAGKRLPTNAEWQVGANGTPDTATDDRATTCNTDATATTKPTGARRACVSARGAFDMVGNVAEWVADWVPLSTACPDWGGFSDDVMCLAGANTVDPGPGAVVRGGFFFLGALNGPLAILGTIAPTRAEPFLGFRCGR